MKWHVIVEGKRDAQIVTAMLNEAGHARAALVGFGSTSSAANALARMLLASCSGPVFLIADADRREAGGVRGDLEYLLESVNGSGLPFHVWVVVPEIESVLFENERPWAAVLKKPLTDVQRVRARFEPKALLADLGFGPDARFTGLLKHPGLRRALTETALCRDLVLAISNGARTSKQTLLPRPKPRAARPARRAGGRAAPHRSAPAKRLSAAKRA
ncbi:MAG: hypothetical protein HY719_08010 [Planctomycetes bacterium]|nr:hypothetical protein [Planctomycetota bacterium]